MKKFIAVFLLSFSSVSYAHSHEHKKVSYTQKYEYTITRVVDGDTVEFEAKFLPAPLKPTLRLRVYGVDTPEKAPRALCESEAKMGAQATELTKKLVSSSTKKEIIIREWDKFGGRVLGDLVLDGVSLRDSLIKAGLAREYYGDKKESWCK